MNDANRSMLVPLSEAARFFPRRSSGRKISVDAIRRRIVKGWRGVKLRAVRDGGVWFTAQQWVEEFLDACTRKAQPDVPVPPTETPGARWADEQLAKLWGTHGKQQRRRAAAQAQA